MVATQISSMAMMSCWLPCASNHSVGICGIKICTQASWVLLKCPGLLMAISVLMIFLLVTHSINDN